MAKRVYKKWVNRSDILLGTNLKWIRRQYEWEPADMAKLLDMSVSTYMNWERGDTIPKLTQLNFIQRKIGIGADVLMSQDLRLLTDRYQIDLLQMARELFKPRNLDYLKTEG